MITQSLLTGKIYPDRQFSIGFCPKKKKRAEDKRYDRDFASQSDVDYSSLADWYEGTNNVGGSFRSLSEAPLFIKGTKSSRAKRGSYGKHGITRYGRRFVKNSALLLERKYGRKRLGFVTCTLPSFPEPIHHRLNGSWGELVRRFYQKLKRQLEKISQPFIYTGVTEIQEKRFASSGIPVPHLHFVYLCRGAKSGKYWLYICQIHRAWNEAIRETISLVGYPFTMSSLLGWGSVHAKTVQKSASAYLGKYMSKGAKVLKDMQEAGWTEFPRQWWNACMQCKKMFNDSIIRMDAMTCSSFFYQLECYLDEGSIVWASFVDVCIGGEERTMGLVGELSHEAYRLISASN